MSLIEFASKELIIPLVKKLAKTISDHEDELRILRDEFFDPISLSRMYVEPNCQHYNPADKDEDNHAISEIRAPAFRQLNDFFDGKFTSSTDGNNQLLVLADAGMGKTSLLVMLKLFHWNGNWPNGIRCELLKLGKDSLDRINKLTDRHNTILLLDSLDEEPLAWGRLEQRLLELLDHTKNFRRVVISCRTQFFPEGDKDPFARLGKLEIGGFICPMFYLSPFSPQQMEEYLEKKFPPTFFEKILEKQNLDKIRAYMILEKMHSLRMRPFLLSNIEDLMENPDANWNDYSVYAALVERWLNREEIRIRSQARKRGTPSESLPDKQKLWNVCEIVACWMYENRVRTLSQTDFKKIIKTIPDIELIEELEHGSKSLLNKQSDSHFRFSHYSIQEFLIVHSRNQELDTQYFTPQMWSFVETADWSIPRSWLENAPISILPPSLVEIICDIPDYHANDSDALETKRSHVILIFFKHKVLVFNFASSSTHIYKGYKIIQIPTDNYHRIVRFLASSTMSYVSITLVTIGYSEAKQYFSVEESYELPPQATTLIEVLVQRIVEYTKLTSIYAHGEHANSTISPAAFATAKNDLWRVYNTLETAISIAYKLVDHGEGTQQRFGALLVGQNSNLTQFF